VTGVTIWLARSERSAAQGEERRPVRQAGLVHAQREGIKSPRSPGTGTGRCRMNAGIAGLTWLFGTAMKAQP
jgi:hypothetical protein